MEKLIGVKNGYKIIHVNKEVSPEQLEENRQRVLSELDKIFNKKVRL
jgi:hypothetical protein